MACRSVLLMLLPLSACVIPVTVPPAEVDLAALEAGGCDAILAARAEKTAEIAARTEANGLGEDGGVVVLPPAVFVVAGPTDPELLSLREERDLIDGLAAAQGCGAPASGG